MQRPIRRKERETDLDETKKLLADCAYGILASVDSDGQPYTTPLSYIFHDNSIYFHCATEGHKLDNIRANPSVSFCVVGRTKTLPDKFSTEYESAVVFGAAEEVHGDEKMAALVRLLGKYSQEFIPEGIEYAAGKINKTAVVKITIKQLTGKARK